jgi:hypothetical protein
MERTMHARLSVLAAALSVATFAAHAAPPANLAGTTWNAMINRNAETIVILTQSGPGIPGGPDCVSLAGTYGIAPLRGWYCPANGRFLLQHQNISSLNTMQVFVGTVADEVIGQPRYMAGSAFIVNSNFGKLGEVNFSATSQ